MQGPGGERPRRAAGWRDWFTQPGRRQQELVPAAGARVAETSASGWGARCQGTGAWRPAGVAGHCPASRRGLSSRIRAWIGLDRLDGKCAGPADLVIDNGALLAFLAPYQVGRPGRKWIFIWVT
jgi:hypothetical protein